MAKYKKRPKDKQEFIEGASYDQQSEGSKAGRPPKPESEKLKPFTTRLQPDIWEKIKVFAYYKRAAQREVVEAALKQYFDGKEEELEKAYEHYENAGEL